MSSVARGVARTLVVVGALVLVVAPGAGAQAIDPCDAPPPPGSIVGGDNNDQIWGTSGNDVIFGGKGNDVIKGLGGDDILCGGEGHDGLNGGSGNDHLSGGTGYDLIVGHDGNDTLLGGQNPDNIGDGMFGGNGDDTLIGNDDDGLGGQPDYMLGGPGSDTLVSGISPPDQTYQDTQPNSEFDNDTECLSLAAQEIGVYGAPGRLDVRSPGPCLTIEGQVANLAFAADGDKVFNVKSGGTTYHVEFMPRDRPYFPSTGLDNGDTVFIRGLHVTDSHCTDPDGSSCQQEIHPVYRFRFVVDVAGDANKCLTFATRCFSGPKYAGSPNQIRPDDGQLINIPPDPDPSRGRRYCWDELGQPCDPWDPNGEPFS